MSDFRAYAPGTSPVATQLTLSPEESHHLVTVNRCAAGDPVTAFDGAGHEWLCVCTEPSKNHTSLEVRTHRIAAPRPCELTLAQALPKGAVMDEIVRQATELGAARLMPLLSARSQVQLDAERAEKKTAKWRTASIEAAKQCGNPWLPEISPPLSLAAFLADHASTHDLLLVASLQTGAIPLRQAVTQARAKLGRQPRRVAWLVGPEGDFAPEEYAALAAKGAVPVTLGALVLRCDTAAVVALGSLLHEISSA